MSYATLVDLKTYLGIVTNDADALLNACLQRAEATLDAHFSARFEATTMTRRYTRSAVRGPWLILDHPVLVVTEIKNGDGAVLPSTAYRLGTPNSSPHYAIVLTDPAYRWITDDDIEVVGSWGYTVAPPASVTQATLRLAAFLYRQKDAQVFDVVAEPSLGTLTVPAALPRDVQTLIMLLQSQYQLG
jgi:hypothetical protein